MSYDTNSSVLKYRWSQVCGAFFLRYPNPWSKHVLSDDVISREVSGPVLKTVRMIIKKNKIPNYFNYLFSGCADDGIYMEESYINRDTKTIVSYTRTLSFRTVGMFDEKCTYTGGAELNSAWTTLKREAWATGSAFYVRPFERYVVSRYTREARKSSKGLNYVLKEMYMNDDSMKGAWPRIKAKMPPLILPKLMKKSSCEGEDFN